MTGVQTCALPIYLCFVHDAWQSCGAGAAQHQAHAGVFFDCPCGLCTDAGLICGIAGYPASECGAEIDEPVAEEVVAIEATSEPESSSSQSAPILLAVLGLFLLSAFFLNRRRTR